MKIGVISDIHSNILALEAVFNKFKEENVDKVIGIGDIVGIGPYPEKCIEFLMNNQDKILSLVRGNHEKYLLYGTPKQNHKDAPPMSDEEISMHVWNHSRVNNKQREYINGLKIRDYIEVEGKKIVVEHYPMDENNVYKGFIKSPNADELEERFDEKNADVYLFGHTHKKIYFNKGNKLYINPGSLGCPKGSEFANAGILNIENSNIEYIDLYVKYDVDKVIEDIKQLNYPLCEVMLENFYIKNNN